MLHRTVLVAVVATSGAAAFQAPLSSGRALARSAPLVSHGPARAPRAVGLRMADEPTLGLAEPYLADVKEAKDVFAFLQSKSYSPLTSDQEKQVTDAITSASTQIEELVIKDGKLPSDDFVSTWVYSKVWKNGGFNEFAEKVNGRVAQVAFPCVLLQTFDGDFLDLLSSHPIQATFWTWAIIAASVVTAAPPIGDEKIGGDPAKAVIDALPESASAQGKEVIDKIKTIFTPEAELTNSRAAMAAMGVWILTALAFQAAGRARAKGWQRFVPWGRKARVCVR